MQVPGLRIPPTRGCRRCRRPEVTPAHTCTNSIPQMPLFVYGDFLRIVTVALSPHPLHCTC